MMTAVKYFPLPSFYTQLILPPSITLLCFWWVLEWEAVAPLIITLIFSQNSCTLFLIVLLKKKRPKKVVIHAESSLPPSFKAFRCKAARPAGYKTPVFDIWCLICFRSTASMENISSYPIYAIWLGYKYNQNALQSTFAAVLAFQFCNGAKEATHRRTHAHMHTLPHQL